MARTLLFAVFSFALLTGSAAIADEGWYIGASLGSGEANKLSFEDIDDGSALSGSLDDRDFGWKVLGGYSYNEFISIEGSYIDLGEIALNAQSDGNGSIFDPGSVTVRIAAKGATLSVVARMPVTAKLDGFVRAGFFAWKSETTLSNAAIGDRKSDDDGSDPYFGLGASYRFTEQVSLRGEYEKFSDIRDRDGSLLSLGLTYAF